jgi:hypothetical protein
VTPEDISLAAALAVGFGVSVEKWREARKRDIFVTVVRVEPNGAVPLRGVTVVLSYVDADVHHAVTKRDHVHIVTDNTGHGKGRVYRGQSFAVEVRNGEETLLIENSERNRWHAIRLVAEDEVHLLLIVKSIDNTGTSPAPPPAAPRHRHPGGRERGRRPLGNDER